MPYIGVSPQFGVRRKHTYTATAGQTSFSGAGSEGVTLSYTDSNFVDVYQNGVKLGDADYTSTSGTAIVLAQGASVDDLVEIIVFDAFSAADTVSKADGGTFDGNVTMGGTLAVTGNQTVGGTLGVTGNQTNSGSVTITGDLASSTSGTSNFRAGVNAGNSIASGGNYNTVVGDEAGTAITTGDNNTLLGYQTGDALTTPFGNVAIGDRALSSETTGQRNTAVGSTALFAQNNTSDELVYNTAVGYQAGGAVTTGQKNTIVGALAGDALTDADFNTALGYNALGADTKGSNSVAIGYQALMTQNFTSATDAVNTAVGHNCGTSITTARGSALLGANAGDAITDGLYNTCIGTGAGSDITTGEANVMIGYLAGSYSNDFITGSQNVCVGPYIVAGGTSDVGANGIGYNITAHGGYTTVGNGSNDIRALHGSTTWSTVSDERYKKNIEDAKAGLSFINALRPRTFKYKTLGELPETFSAYKADSTEVFKNESTNHGFVAQEVKQVIDADSDLKDGFKLWDERGDGSQEIAETALIPMLVKAIQELSAKVTSLEAEVKALKGE